MSHFIVTVIVPPRRLKDVLTFVAEQMAPYDENAPVAPYVCYSVWQAAADIAADIAELERILAAREPGYDLEKLRTSLEHNRSLTPEEVYKAFLDEHEGFNDRGEPISTANPDAKWDWFVVGGRWNGWLHGRESTDGWYSDNLNGNLASVAHVLERDLVPFAVLTPDGFWHERGRMGWFAVVTDEKDDWDAEARALFEKYHDHHVVVVDCHI